MTPDRLYTSAALCFAVAIVLNVISVWFKFRYVARWIMCVPTVGAIFHSGWIFDVLIRHRMSDVSQEALRVGELAGFIWVGLGIMFSTLAFMHYDLHGDADSHGEPCTNRAFESEKTRTAREMRELRGSGHAVAVRR